MKLFSQTVLIALFAATFAQAEGTPVVLRATDKDDLRAAVDKLATVTGKIRLHRGRPEIEINRPG